MRALIADLVVCLRFCTRLPLPVVASEKDPYEMTEFRRAAGMIPVAGGLVGGLAGLVLVGAAGSGFPPAVSALLAIATMILITGALHEDGLADCADGFGGGTTRERKLDIMRDSAIGTFGAVALGLTLLLRFSVLAQLAGESVEVGAAVLVGGGAISRAAALVPLALLPSARRTGAGFAAGRPQVRAFALAGSLASAFALVPVLTGTTWAQSLAGIAAAIAAALAFTALAKQQIGGHTGDVAGACQQISEIAFYLAYART